MTGEQILGLTLALLVMAVGLAGSILPILPSTPVVLLAAVGHRLYFGPHGASNLILLALLFLTALSLVMDHAASVLGARKLGATWRGAVGAVIGGLAGLFFSLPGVILGPFLGATLFEMLGGRHWKQATRAGAGAVLGLLLGAAGKFACCVVMMALFAISVVMRSGGGPAA